MDWNIACYVSTNYLVTQHKFRLTQILMHENHRCYSTTLGSARLYTGIQKMQYVNQIINIAFA